MKKTMLIASFAAIFCLSSCKDESTQSSGSENVETKTLSTENIQNPNTASEDDKVVAMPKFQWNHTTHDFGKIYENQTVSHAFTFTNVGDADLILSDAKASCGCTIPKIPKEPIKPGESSEILVEFKQTEGTFKKEITVTANTSPNTAKLFITANVVKE